MSHHDNSALPTFNDDGPFAVQLLAVIVSIYLSMKQSRRRTCSPKKKASLELQDSSVSLSVHTLMVNVSYVVQV